MTRRELSKVFEDRKIRTVWDDDQEKWYFSIVDVVGALTDQPDTDQMQYPELSIQQAMMDYKRLGYSDNWITNASRV